MVPGAGNSFYTYNRTKPCAIPADTRLYHYDIMPRSIVRLEWDEQVITSYLAILKKLFVHECVTAIVAQRLGSILMKF